MVDKDVQLEASVTASIRRAMHADHEAMLAVDALAQEYQLGSALRAANLALRPWAGMATHGIATVMEEADRMSRLAQAVAAPLVADEAWRAAERATQRLDDIFGQVSQYESVAQQMVSSVLAAARTLEVDRATERLNQAFNDLTRVADEAYEGAFGIESYLEAIRSGAGWAAWGDSALAGLEASARAAARAHPELFAASSIAQARSLWEGAAADHRRPHVASGRALPTLPLPDGFTIDRVLSLLSLLITIYSLLLALETEAQLNRIEGRLIRMETAQLTADDVRSIIEETVARTLLAQPYLVRKRPALIREFPEPVARCLAKPRPVLRSSSPGVRASGAGFTLRIPPRVR